MTTSLSEVLSFQLKSLLVHLNLFNFSLDAPIPSSNLSPFAVLTKPAVPKFSLQAGLTVYTAHYSAITANSHLRLSKIKQSN